MATGETFGQSVNRNVPSAVAGERNSSAVSLARTDDALERARLAAYMRDVAKQQDAAMARGAAWGQDKFGWGNKDMSEILKARKDLAFGTGNDAQTQLMRDQGIQGINSQLATGLRGLKGMQGISGIRGGAAIGQALPALTKANQARSTLEANLAIEGLRRRDQALKDYESSITGERAGALGAQFGFAGLDAQNRSGAQQYILGRDFLTAAQAALAPPLEDQAQEEPLAQTVDAVRQKATGFTIPGTKYRFDLPGINGGGK